MSDSVQNIYTEGLTDTHPLYRQASKVWQKNQDAVDGEEAIKAHRRKVYLPPLAGMVSDPVNGEALYGIYLTYANWFNASGRTADGLRGLVFRKDPIVNAPDIMEPILVDIDLKNQGIEGFSKEIFTQVLIKNRVGVLVDFPETNNIPVTIAEAEALNLRPYASMYTAENILNWREERYNNKYQTTFVTLHEIEYEQGENEFDSIEVDIIRVLDFDEEGNYRQRVYKRKDMTSAGSGIAVQTVETSNSLTSGTGYVFDREINPKINGEPIKFIPFCPITSDGVSWKLDFPVLNDLVNVNVAHYRNSANYENGLLFTGNPTPCVAGLVNNEANKSTLRLGSSTVLQFKESGQWGFLEFGGTGLSEIREAMEEKKNEMAILGARILSSDKKAVEAAETASIHRAGEQGVLGDIANSISLGLTKVLQTMALWLGVSEEEIQEINVSLNTDFNPAGLNPQQLQAIMLAWQQGRLSNEDVFVIMQKGELIDSIMTFEEHEEILEAQGPALGTVGIETDEEEEPEEEDMEDEEDIEEELEE
jgi:hypothetical protein